MAKQIQWIPEKEAAEKLNRKPRTLRKLVKAGTLNISFTHVNGRSYCYDESGITKVLNNNATIIY
jgi:predicted site-specific integrase-resolvase